MKLNLQTHLICIAVMTLAGCGGGSSPSTSSQTTSKATAAEAKALAASPSDSFNSADAYVPSALSSKSEAQTVIVKTLSLDPQQLAAQSDAYIIDLGAVDPTDLAKRDQNNKPSASGITAKAYQIGIGRDVTATSTAKGFEKSLTWTTRSNGNAMGSARFVSSGAVGIRLGLLVSNLPNEALVRISATDDTEALEISGAAINQAIAANVSADGDSADARTYWLPSTKGGSTELAIELPAGMPASTVAVSVPSLTHMVESAEQAAINQTLAKTACADATPDAMCSTPLPPAANAVGAMEFNVGASGYVCTGSLLADKANSGTPYFLSAHHCFSTQTVASTLTTKWFYRTSACNASTPNPGIVSSPGGATLLWAKSATTSNFKNPVGTDTLFVRLNATPPAGVMYLGWTAAKQAISDAVEYTALHNPGGDYLRHSTAVISNMGVVDANHQITVTPDTSQPMYEAAWTTGITEGGSSGSALLLNGTTANPKMVGQLFGGYSSCSNRESTDYYGRFDFAYQNGLIDWLNPGYRMVFRFYNTINGTHFFSANVAERDTVRTTIPSLAYEAPAFMVSPAAGTGLSPVYRFLNQATGTHFYTINESEKTAVLAMPGFNYEGIAWYARQSSNPGADTIEVFRFMRQATGTHLYTINVAERDNIINNQSAAYTYEGVAYRAWVVN